MRNLISFKNIIQISSVVEALCKIQQISRNHKDESFVINDFLIYWPLNTIKKILKSGKKIDDILTEHFAIYVAS